MPSELPAPATSAPSRYPRWWLPLLGVVLAAVLLSLSVPVLWVNRLLTDTDVYMRTVAPLAEDPEIRNAIAQIAADAIVKRLDLQATLEGYLPGQLKIISAPLAQAANDLIRAQASTLVHSEWFPKTWETVNRVSHKTLLATLTGQDIRGARVEAGVVSLNIQPLVEALRAQLAETKLSALVEIPDVTLFDEPIEIYRSETLARLASTFRLATRAAYVLPVAALAVLALSVALSDDRRRAFLWFGAALATSSMLPLQTIILSQRYVAARLQSLAAISPAAAHNAYAIVFRDLMIAERIAITVGIIIWLVALALGQRARRLRSTPVG